MNVNDTDIVRSLLLEAGMQETDQETEADLLLTNVRHSRGSRSQGLESIASDRGRFLHAVKSLVYQDAWRND
jgi:hypothetical protein